MVRTVFFILDFYKNVMHFVFYISSKNGIVNTLVTVNT